MNYGLVLDIHVSGMKQNGRPKQTSIWCWAVKLFHCVVKKVLSSKWLHVYARDLLALCVCVCDTYTVF